MKLLSVRYMVKTPCPEKMLSSLIGSGIPFSHPVREEEGFSFTSALGSKKSVLRWSKEAQCTVFAQYEGIIANVLKLKQRPGIVFGTILSLFLIYLSTFYVWSVRIKGNTTLDDKEIVQLLEECGFGEGTRKSSVDVNEIQNTALARCHELSFLSINIHGMVAEVEVHERITSPRAVDEKAPYNLVADFDGVIVSSVVLDGMSLFNTGDTVFKGQLLVSGLVDSTSGVTNIRHARGKVYARTCRNLTFTVPYEITQKLYIGKEVHQGIRILGHSFYRKPKSDGRDFETSLTEQEVRLCGLLLPVTKEIRLTEYYENKTVHLSVEEAEQKAYEEYRSYISTELDSATLIDEVFEVKQTDSALILTAEVSAIENIATEKKIEITE